MSRLKEAKAGSAGVKGQSNGTVMAPAILTNGKGEGTTKTKSKKTSKHKRQKTVDPQDEDVPAKKPLTIDFVALKAKLAAEDSFITSLLSNIPKQGVSVDPDDGSETSEITGPASTEEPLNRATDPEELKARLAAKLSQFKGKKLDFSDKQKKNKLQRKLDKLEKKKLKKKNNKMKFKIAKLAQATMKAASSTASSTTPSTSSSVTVKTEIPEPVVQSRPPRPIYNSEGRMVFSKFDFGELTTPDSSTIRKTNLDPKAALHKMKKAKEKVKELEAKGDVEKAKSIVEKKAWEGAIMRAEGIKVKDNVELLAKSIKKREKQKQHSKKKWEERIESQEKQKEDQQKKRKANINKKKTEKKEKKLSRLAKRGKFIV